MTDESVRESVIERHLVTRVVDLGGLCPKWKSPQRVNVPDRIVILPGGFIFFVEVKATGQMPTPAQEREHVRLRHLGQFVFVVDSKAAVDELLGEV